MMTSREGASSPASSLKLTPQMRTLMAFNRFGLGPKPGGMSRVGFRKTAGLAACLREVNDPKAPLITVPDVPDYAEACRNGVTATMAGTSASNAAMNREMGLRYGKIMESEVGFVERLVLFWSNHFSMSCRKNYLTRATLGHFERTVIRPHVLGQFPDMLRGAMTHPAMLAYLDSTTNYGPNSVLGRKFFWTFNENLSREVLELHTLGTKGGHTQADVTNFGKILTGWMVHDPQHEKAGQFFFNPDAHEPGSFTVMGQAFGQPGMQKGLAVLDMLARHPATAEHIAFKLLLHFVSDEPAPSMVKKLAKVFLRTNGNLKAVALALLNLQEAWTAPLNRIRQPHLWVMAQARALGFSREFAAASLGRFNTYLGKVDNQPWCCLTPDGFPDKNYKWMQADAMRLRKELACQLLIDASFNGWALPANPAQFASNLYPGVLTPATAAEIAAWNHDPVAAGALFFMSPEFMRR